MEIRIESIFVGRPQSFTSEGDFKPWISAIIKQRVVVALGAPLGAIVVELISRKPTLLIVSAPCIIQFVWTLIHERVTGMTLLGSLLAVVLCNCVFHVLYSFGHSPAAYDDERIELSDLPSGDR